jgi:hypothetical protein
MLSDFRATNAGFGDEASSCLGRSCMKWGQDGELSPIDQADVMIMLLDDATVRQARVGPLIGEQDDLSLEVTGLLWVEASQPDPLVDAARLLYEASRLSGAAFLKALGGYTYRTDEHPGVRP